MNDLVGKIVFGDKDATEDLRFRNQLMLCKQNEALTDNVKQLVAALEDMVFQFAYRNKEGMLITAGISALEIAFDVLGIEDGADPETLDGTKFHPDTRKALENALDMRDREIEKLKAKLDAVYGILEEWKKTEKRLKEKGLYIAAEDMGIRITDIEAALKRLDWEFRNEP